MTQNHKPNEISIHRIYQASLNDVWSAWTDTQKVAKWWGPRGFTITTHSKDLQPGGHWHYTMHGPDGVDYENKTIYHEVKEAARLVYDHGGNDDRPPLFHVTVDFKEQQGQTHMTMTMAFPTAEKATEIKAFIKKAGGNATWDRLGEFLAEETQKKYIFIINRSFNTSAETLFAMWTQPDLLVKWLPPTGFTMDLIRFEGPKNSTVFYSMNNGQSVQFFGKIHHREATPPHRLVYSQSFCDKNGKMSRHPLAPIWPEEMLTIVEFHSEGKNQTRATVTWEPSGASTRDEIQFFAQSRDGMTQGWTGSFDKLEDILER